MALFRRARGGNLGRNFRNNRDLQKFVLTDVTSTGKSLGTGSYGSVEEVIYQHLPCAGKKLHEALLDVQNEGVPEMVQKYLEECQLMSSLRHPNVTQFLGICFLPGTQLPLLVMEQLETSLDDLLEHIPHLPISLKCSVLENVASGLLYLHKRNPPVIHRDLTAKNVLLTSHLAAKITDMGNSRIIDMEPGRLAQTLSKLPGTLVYMPPEALDDRHSYGPPLDVFSFGHLALFTVLQTFPGDLLPSTYPNPDSPLEVRGRTELERRERYIAVMEAEFARLCPALVQLIKQCLLNAPDKRPSTDELLTRLQRVRSEMGGAQGGCPMNVDIMIRVRMAKEMKVKDGQIDELTKQKDVDREEKERELKQKEREMEALRRELGEKTKELQEMEEKLRDRETQLKKELKDKDDETSKLRVELSKSNASTKELVILKQPDELSMLPVYMAKFDYTGKKDEDLSFTKGDLLYIIKIEGKNWWCAQSCKTGKAGFIPSNYVTLHKNAIKHGVDDSDPEIDRGQIRLNKKLDERQFWEVWEGASRMSSDSPVAVTVKMFKPGKVSTPKLLQEMTLIRKLKHPKLVHIYGVCTKEEPVYFVRESMKENLHDYLRADGKALKLPQLVDIAAQVAAGMAYLEKENYIHQSLTASNVLVGENGEFKVTDYGLTRAFIYDPYDEASYVYPIKWTAPEAILYNRFSIKSDVWSFGILLTAIITKGQILYPGMSSTEVLQQIQKGYQMPCPPGCPEKLYKIMLACWKDAPDSRLTFETLQWQLEEFFTTDEDGYTNADIDEYMEQLFLADDKEYPN